MVNTVRFQREVAQKLSCLFEAYFASIHTTDQWSEFTEINRAFTLSGEIYSTLERFLQAHNFEVNNDISALFLIEKLLNDELINVRMQQNNNYRNRVGISSYLECLYESRTRYYDTDTGDLPLNYQPGSPIYSPITDLAITPSIHKPGNRNNHSIGVYSLFRGPIIFDTLARLSLISRLKQQLASISVQNYRSMGLVYQDNCINIRPLCLFAIEIENQSNMKHMMGDFINSLMISKYPIVLVPENNFLNTLDLLKLTKVIYDIKQVNVVDIFSHVMVISITQFRQAINPFLDDFEIAQLQEYEVG